MYAVEITQSRYREAVRSRSGIPFTCPACIRDVLEEVAPDVDTTDVSVHPMESTRRPSDTSAMESIEVSAVTLNEDTQFGEV